MAPGSTYTEPELFRRIADGDEEAFTIIFHKYRSSLFDYAMAVTKTKAVAEELVQDCFLRLWTNRHTLRKVENPAAFLHRMARNAAIDHLRRLALDNKAQQKVRNAIFESGSATMEAVELSETQKILQEAVQQLTPHQQQVFMLSRYEGLSYEEISEKLGISKNTVKNQLVKSLARLRAYLLRHYDKPVVLIIMTFIEDYYR